MGIPFIRPAKMDDLERLFQFSIDAGYGITSLPRNLDLLSKRIHDSLLSFQNKTTHAGYLFCLEYESEVIGTSGIISHIGVKKPFFTYHLLQESVLSPFLHIDRKIPLLHFTQAQKHPTEIGSLFLAEPFRQKHNGTLLSLSRFLFISLFKQRFAGNVFASLRGVNHRGVSPFWEAVGRPFYQMDFPQADLLRIEYPSCIDELFPRHPLYLDLLPKEAQSVLGLPHLDTLPAKKILEKQGFRSCHYMDLFDGGPYLYAHTEEIHAVKESKTVLISALRSEINTETHALVSNTHLDFRATFAPLLLEEDQAILQPAVASALQVEKGDPIRYYIN